MVENEEEDDDIISEGAEYSPKSEFSKAIHVSEAVKLCRENRAKEMKPGYMNSVVDKNGNEIQTWIADSRKVYIASVDALRVILKPERKRNKDFKEIDENFDKIKKEIFEKYAYEEFQFNEESRSFPTKKFKKTGAKYLPEIDEEVMTNTLRGMRPEYIKGYWNPKVKAYWLEMLDLYDEYFEELNILIDKLNYFKSGVAY